jgi:putative CocE/NonD family hydrolase
MVSRIWIPIISTAAIAVLAGLSTRAALAAEPEGFTPPPPSIVEQRRAWVSLKYERSEHMVPMRDGVKLFTVVYTPRDLDEPYPFLLLRTPYSVRSWAFSPITASLGPTPEFDREGYIFVYQDVRGKHGSEGVYDALRPFNAAPSDPAAVDESTDLYDTIEWLLANVNNHNGRVGQWGISADGLMAAFGLMAPHPALRAVSPQGTPADFYVGDDVYHNGALHLAYIFGWVSANARESGSSPFTYDSPWAYEYFLGLDMPVADYNRELFDGKAGLWDEVIAHPDYDAWWQARNVTRHLDDVRVPVLNVGGWFDAEDFYGSLAIYEAIERTDGNASVMVMGPWRHGGWYGWDGDFLANVPFGRKTSLDFRERFQLPFFNHYLKDKGEWAPADFTGFDSGAHAWREFPTWPPPSAETLSLYFAGQGRLARAPATAADSATPFDEFESDPGRPVPHTAEIRNGAGAWWVVEDQRFAASRPDVLVYSSEPLKADLTLAGRIGADLFVSTSATDTDWVVKLIDVFPAGGPHRSGRPEDPMAGYQMLLSAEIMRGRYRNDLSAPEPFEPGEVVPVRFRLQDRLHTFRRGHRIMVQIQSSWFPLFDRNPQQYMSIFHAGRLDFVPAHNRVHRSHDAASRLTLDIIAQ